MIVDRKLLERELRETKMAFSNLIEANVKLSNERNWAIEDKERTLRRIERTLELIDSKEKLNKEELKEALTEDYIDE